MKNLIQQKGKLTSSVLTQNLYFLTLVTVDKLLTNMVLILNNVKSIIYTIELK